MTTQTAGNENLMDVLPGEEADAYRSDPEHFAQFEAYAADEDEDERSYREHLNVYGRGFR